MEKPVRNDKGEYVIHNKPMISVTTVQGRVCGMFESLMNNYHCKLCKDYNNQGNIPASEQIMGIVHAQNDRTGKAEYGTMAHGVLEDVFFKKAVVPVEFSNRFDQIDTIYRNLGLELLLPETTLHSDDWESAGTADVIAVSRKFKVPKLYIIDYKTGSAQKKKEIVQIGAYGKFLCEMIKRKEIFIKGLPEKFTLHGLVLHVGRDDDFKVKPTHISPQQMKVGAGAYKNLLGYYRYTKTKL